MPRLRGSCSLVSTVIMTGCGSLVQPEPLTTGPAAATRMTAAAFIAKWQASTRNELTVMAGVRNLLCRLQANYGCGAEFACVHTEKWNTLMGWSFLALQDNGLRSVRRKLIASYAELFLPVVAEIN